MRWGWLISAWCVAASASEVLYDLPVDKRAEFDHIISQYRCLVCAGESIEQSQSLFAVDLRDRIYHWVLEGKSPEEIQQILVDRFGEEILQRPTSLWHLGVYLLPSFWLIVGAMVLLLKFRCLHKEVRHEDS